MNFRLKAGISNTLRLDIKKKFTYQRNLAEEDGLECHPSVITRLLKYKPIGQRYFTRIIELIYGENSEPTDYGIPVGASALPDQLLHPISPSLRTMREAIERRIDDKLTNFVGRDYVYEKFQKFVVLSVLCNFMQVLPRSE